MSAWNSGMTKRRARRSRYGRRPPNPERAIYLRFGDWFAWLNVAAVPALIMIAIGVPRPKPAAWRDARGRFEHLASNRVNAPGT